MRLMHSVSLDIASKQQRAGGLQQSAWPWVATSPSFAESFHAKCKREIPGLDCTAAATKLQAMSGGLLQRGPVNGALLPAYYREACGAMQLLSKGGAAPAEPRTHRAKARHVLEAALQEQGVVHDAQKVALFAEERGGAERAVPTPSQSDVTKIVNDVEYWLWAWAAYSNPGVKAALTAPFEWEKKAACEAGNGKLREVGAGIGAIKTAGGSLGMGYGYDEGAGKVGTWKIIKSSGYYTLCAGLGLDGGIDAGISSSTMLQYGNIAGISMVYSAEVCYGLCAGYSNIYCLPWNLRGHEYCGWGVMTGGGVSIGIGWETCVTKATPASVYHPTSEWINCPASGGGWWR